jgi:hypothetical protein
MTRYATLRSWAFILKALAIPLIIAAVFGTVALAFEVSGVWETLGVIFIGIPGAIFLATLPIALGQLMNVIADIGDAVHPRS